MFQSLGLRFHSEMESQAQLLGDQRVLTPIAAEMREALPMLYYGVSASGGIDMLRKLKGVKFQNGEFVLSTRARTAVP